MIIKILGSGCKKCVTLTENTRTALANLGREAEVIKVTEISEIAAMGVMSTPALAIDDHGVDLGVLVLQREIDMARSDRAAIAGNLAAHPHETEGILDGALQRAGEVRDGPFRRIASRRGRFAVHGGTIAGSPCQQKRCRRGAGPLFRR